MMGLRRRRLTAAILVATVTGAHAAPLTVKSSGEDFIAASQDERSMWGYAASRALHNGAGGAETFDFGEALAECLENMLTKMSDDTGKPMQMLTGTSLPKLTALCATAMQKRLDAGRR